MQTCGGRAHAVSGTTDKNEVEAKRGLMQEIAIKIVTVKTAVRGLLKISVERGINADFNDYPVLEFSRIARIAFEKALSLLLLLLALASAFAQSRHSVAHPSFLALRI